MLDVLKAKIAVWADSCGATVVMQEEPFAVCILTGIMRRAHSTQFARDVCFVDSTASCDATNTAITFMLAPTVAGAVPLAVVMTDSTSYSSYAAGFSLLKTILPADAFAEQQFPSVFVTDDCDAERSALHACWPQAALKLCLFHVAQAVWRWLWAEAHHIAKDDRKQLMMEFRKIMYCCDKDEAENAYAEAISSETAVDYENFQQYLSGLWARKELWCLAWRDVHQRGHHTNNFAEVTVRLYKDVVLRRAKAYNVVALVDFTVRVMEEYYRSRLRDFSHGRVSAQRLLFEKLAKKAYLTSADQISDNGDGQYDVPGSDDTELYHVDANVGCCSCREGMHGKFCKHQLAVMQLFKAQFPNAPGMSAVQRHSIAYIALGSKAAPLEFYADITEQVVVSHSVADVQVHEQQMLSPVGVVDSSTGSGQSDESAVAETDGDNDGGTTDDYNTVLALQQELHQRFGTLSSGCEKMAKRLRHITTATQWESFVHTQGAGVVCSRQQSAGGDRQLLVAAENCQQEGLLYRLRNRFDVSVCVR